jgi:hypothetical protein
MADKGVSQCLAILGRQEELAMNFTAVFEKVSEGYIGFVEELPGANTQGATLEEARENLVEAVELVCWKPTARSPRK